MSTKNKKKNDLEHKGKIVKKVKLSETISQIFKANQQGGKKVGN